MSVWLRRGGTSRHGWPPPGALMGHSGDRGRKERAAQCRAPTEAVSPSRNQVAFGSATNLSRAAVPTLMAPTTA